MNNDIKCHKCNRVFYFLEVWKELDNLDKYVFCNFCNTKHFINRTKHIDTNHIVIKTKHIDTKHIVNSTKHIDDALKSIKCRKCSTNLDENIDQSKRLVKCFKCGTTNSRTPSSKTKNSTNNGSNKEEINKKYQSENKLLDISGIRELYTNSDGHLAHYGEWDYDENSNYEEPYYEWWDYDEPDL